MYSVIAITQLVTHLCVWGYHSAVNCTVMHSVIAFVSAVTQLVTYAYQDITVQKTTVLNALHFIPVIQLVSCNPYDLRISHFSAFYTVIHLHWICICIYTYIYIYVTFCMHHYSWDRIALRIVLQGIPISQDISCHCIHINVHVCAYHKLQFPNSI